jgi:hypothetical protein
MLDDVRQGKDDALRTPLLGDLEAEEILERFSEEVFSPNETSINESLKLIEVAQKEKFGPRSIQAPWSKRKEDILDLFSPTTPNASFEDPLAVTGNSRLRPLGDVSVIKAMKRSTSAGLPYLRSKGQIIDENLSMEGEWPCVLFTRTQEGGKTRNVLGYAISSLLREGRFFLPYFDWFRTLPYFSAYGGPDSVDEAISTLLFTKDPSHVIISEDFSKFDQSVSPVLIHKCFENVGKHFQEESKAAIAIVRDTFCSIGLVTPDGIYSGDHGIPSGSWFTSVVGSYVHLIAQNAVKAVSERSNQVMGDDGVMVLPSSITSEDIAEIYSKLGLTINPDKSSESKDEVTYLQRLYDSDYKYDGLYRGVYPVYRALNRLIHMERWTNIKEIGGADYFAIRAIAIMENCKWHPLHSELVKWVMKYDKYSLEYSHKSLEAYIANFQPRTSTTIKNQYSDDLVGMERFETMKILRTL